MDEYTGTIDETSGRCDKTRCRLSGSMGRFLNGRGEAVNRVDIIVADEHAMAT